MPILPPILRAAVETMTAAATRAVVDPLIDIAAASYVPPKPQPAPLDWCAVVSRLGVIEYISDASPIDTLSAYREKTIEDSNGEVSVVIIRKEIAALLRPGMLTSSILDRMEALRDAAWVEMGVLKRCP